MKKRIGLFGNGWNIENLYSFLGGVEEAFSDDAVDILLFLTYSIFYMSVHTQKIEYNILHCVNYKELDGAIVMGSGINSNEEINRISQECLNAGIPVVTQGYVFPGIAHVESDNYSGMRDLCNHLIDVHGVKSAVFFAGSEENMDSNERLAAVRTAFRDHEIDFGDEDIVYTDWDTTFVADYARKMAQSGKLPDACICANDRLAMFIVLALSEEGISVPEDVIVTGFDYTEDSQTYYPSIASIDQCFAEDGKRCAELLREQMEGKKTQLNSIIPCTFIPGESCGCFGCRNEDYLRKMMSRTIMTTFIARENMEGRWGAIQRAITLSYDYDNIGENVRKLFGESNGYEGDSIYMFMNPKYQELAVREIDPAEDTELPDELEVMVAKEGGKMLDLGETVRRSEILHACRGTGPNHIYTIMALYMSGGFNLGYLVVRDNKDLIKEKNFHGLQSSIGRAFEMFRTNLRLRHLNSQLTEVIEKDALTKAKNAEAYAQYTAKFDSEYIGDIKHTFAAAVISANGVKEINDKLGHEAGDAYICKCADVIIEEFEQSPVFRTEGDCFTVLIPDEDYPESCAHIEAIIKRTEELAADAALEAQEKPSLSCGITRYNAVTDKSVADVVKRATDIMKTVKEKNKQSKNS